MIRSLIIGMALSVHPTWAATSLGKLIRLAEENAPSIRKVRFDLEQADLEYRSARAKFLPTLDLTSTHGLRDVFPDDGQGTLWDSSLKLSLSETLYDNGESITGYRLAATRKRRLTLEYQLERDNQLLRLALLYYDWSAAHQDHQIAESKRDLLRRQFKFLEAQYKQGIKTKRDVLRIETEVRRLDLDLLKRDNDIANTTRRMAAIAGLEPETLAASAILPEPAEFEGKSKAPTEVAPLKVDEHRRAQILKEQEKEAELETRLVERKYWPELGLTAEVYDSYADYLDTGKSMQDARTWGWSTLLTLNYTILDWGIERRSLEIARVKEKAVRNTNFQTILDLKVSLNDVILRLKELAETLRLARELYEIEQQSYSILQAEYRNGRATYLDLITNLNSSVDARSKVASAYFELAKQKLNYSFHRGTIYEELQNR
ncbi:MAG: TolC family protein [Bdellovibrionales bacterium]